MDADRTLIVVPTYNERENVAPLIPRLLNVAPTADVMLIDDNSPDQTADQAEQLFAV
jgi:dolichol-phosphate mannosyltransferase